MEEEAADVGSATGGRTCAPLLVGLDEDDEKEEGVGA